jgi:pimeloyl-ACP methyl ester carboxylesterase
MNAGAAGEAEWAEGEWSSADGLVLRYRDYPGDPARVPVLCIPGLTRNARDFEGLAAALAPRNRVICVDLRGRGQSDYAKDPASYTPQTYAADLDLLFAATGLDRVIAVGTSLGGIVTMLLAMADAGRLAGVVLNDIGPEIDPAGIERIRSNVGQGRSYETWMHAARDLKDRNGAIYPHYDISAWLRMARQVMVLSNNGRVVLDYDMRIAEPFNDPPPQDPVDLWAAFRALAGRPLLAVRGETSDILSAATCSGCRRRFRTCRR